MVILSHLSPMRTISNKSGGKKLKKCRKNHNFQKYFQYRHFDTIKLSSLQSHQCSLVTNIYVADFSTTVILVTTACWRFYDCDRFDFWDRITMLATFYLSVCHQHLKSVINISKFSPTHFVTNIRHKHRCSRFLCLHFP